MNAIICASLCYIILFVDYKWAASYNIQCVTELDIVHGVEILFPLSVGIYIACYIHAHKVVIKEAPRSGPIAYNTPSMQFFCTFRGSTSIWQ